MRGARELVVVLIGLMSLGGDCKKPKAPLPKMAAEPESAPVDHDWCKALEGSTVECTDTPDDPSFEAPLSAGERAERR